MTHGIVQLAVFVSDWKRHVLSDEDLQALETILMGNPAGGPVMAGTGGLRKLRFAPPSWATGKRGATRVCYAHFPAHNLIYLVTLFGKNEKANLAKAERNAVAKALKQISNSLSTGGRHG